MYTFYRAFFKKEGLIRDILYINTMTNTATFKDRNGDLDTTNVKNIIILLNSHFKDEKYQQIFADDIVKYKGEYCAVKKIDNEWFLIDIRQKYKISMKKICETGGRIANCVLVGNVHLVKAKPTLS